MASSPDTTIIVTGASRGLGQAVAVEAAKQLVIADDGTLHVVLVARNAGALHETKLQIAALPKGPQINVTCHAMDLEDLDRLDDNLNKICAGLPKSNRVILVNNAGSIGFLGPVIDSPSLAEMRRNVDLNVTSCFWVSVRLARFATDQGCQAVIVNISSLVAIADFNTFGIYSAGKAARDKYHTLLAKETPSVRVVNYAPGPLETNMVQEIRSAPELDADLKKNFEQPVLQPEWSARKLLRLLQENTFENGAHIDYYDLPDL
eukprot:Nitzschia sp. Nitz4//scaffold1_size375055//202962//203830//NITZ4_000279-RA/size375055-augustus-gene-0.717-mRNA-1//-1//CDS//3329541054//135//frame0